MFRKRFWAVDVTFEVDENVDAIGEKSLNGFKINPFAIYGQVKKGCQMTVVRLVQLCDDSSQEIFSFTLSSNQNFLG